MKQLITITTILLLITFSTNAQQKVRGPIWITDDANTDVIGLSLSAYPKGIFQGYDTGMSRTFGIKLEVFPLSSFFFLAPTSPVSSSEDEYQSALEGTVSEKIYGLNIETGNFVNKDIYGISATMFLHYSRKNNGISLAGVSNSIERGNGLFITPGGNEVYKGNGIMIGGIFGNGAHLFNGLQISTENYITGRGTGVQIGIFNKAKNFRGIQLGLWNKNDKRSLPIINWQFSK